MNPTNDNDTSNVISLGKKLLERFQNPTDILVDDLTEELLMILEEEGYDPLEPKTLKDIAIIGEMIRAMFYRQDGLPHDYQSLLDNIGVEENG